MEPAEQEAPEAQDAAPDAAQEAPHAAQEALHAAPEAPEPKRRGRPPLTVVCQGVGLGVSCKVVFDEAVPWPWRIRAKSSSVASAGVRKPSSGIARRGVCCRGCGLGSLLDCAKSSR